MSDKYGHTPGVNVQVTGGSVDCDPTDAIGKLMEDNELAGIRLWDHRIVLSGERGIKCEECEMEEELPEIFQQSSGFKEVVYKMYVLGQFKKARCEPDIETDQSVLHDDVTNIGYDPSRVNYIGAGTTTTTKTANADMYRVADMYMSKGERLKINGNEYIHYGNGRFVHETSGREYAPTDLVMKHDNDALKALHPAVADKAKHQLAKMSKVDKTIKDDVQIGDVSTGQNRGGVDHTQSLNDGVTVGSMQAEDLIDEQSMKEKFAQKLSEQKRSFLRR